MPNQRAIAIRALRGLDSQQTFADKLKVARGTVVALEQGTTPSLSTARALVNMGLDPRHVLPPAEADFGPEAA